MLRQPESQSHGDKRTLEYSEPCQIWKMVLFASGFQSLTIFAKSLTILDV